jgi:hypothetical protein
MSKGGRVDRQGAKVAKGRRGGRAREIMNVECWILNEEKE